VLVLLHELMWGQDPFADQPIEGVEVTADRARWGEADVVVFHGPEHRPELRPAKRAGQLWVALSLEAAAHYPLLTDPAFLAEVDLTMTYQQDADVPLTYADAFGDVAGMVFQLRAPAPPKPRAVPVASFVSGAVDRSGRSTYLRELVRHIEVDSYGSFLRNRSLAEDHGRATKVAVIAEYRFAIAFENARGTDYVTEKFFDPLLAGTVPVYLGAPNIEEFAPGRDAYIDAAAYEPAELAALLTRLSNDDEAYQQHFAWKAEPLRPTFTRLLEPERQRPLRRLVRLARARREAALPAGGPN